ncbi:signal peptidase I W [mine drainage metagenome]|uniref:Signal peptidase I W n=1 Tax=mine drainage metagenome TaxID=410659 RepID=A0A1J5RCZ1_9ZZZZ
MTTQRNVRHRRVGRWLENALLVVVLGLGVLGAVAVLSGAYQLRPVLSGSMRPGLPVGGVVVTERVPISALHVRDVVVFHRPDKPDELVVHRIIALNSGASGPVIRTQGDANTVADPWTITLRGGTAYRAVFALPLVGYVAVWAHGSEGSRALIAVGLLLLVGGTVGALVQWRRASRAPTGSRSGRATSAGPSLPPSDAQPEPSAGRDEILVHGLAPDRRSRRVDPQG